MPHRPGPAGAHYGQIYCIGKIVCGVSEPYRDGYNSAELVSSTRVTVAARPAERAWNSHYAGGPWTLAAPSLSGLSVSGSEAF